MPVAYNMACEAPWDFGCVILAEILLSWGSSFRRADVVQRERLEHISEAIGIGVV